jgi:V-type H+-transporting ATPase subunit a
MALSPGYVKDPLYGRVVFPTKEGWPSNYTVCGDPAILCCQANGCSQASIQVWLLLLALISVPILLCCKPWILHSRNKQKILDRQNQTNHDTFGTMELQGNSDDDEMNETKSHGDHGGHGEAGHSFADLMIHQIIETIEFVLGFISNTASYLRLWALSLAHAELAEVFWGKTMGIAIGMENFFVIFLAWGAFAAITVGVLLLMDVLECFLQ